MDQVFFQLLQLRALVTVVAYFLTIVVHNMREILGAFWHLLASWLKCGSVRTINRCSFILGIGRLFAILCCMALFHLFKLVVVHMPTSLGLIVQDIIGLVPLLVLDFLGFEGL